MKEVDLDSLDFHGAKPLSTFTADVNGDGKPDLVIVLDMKNMKLNPSATSAHLRGWLKNSQAFVGEDRITIVSGMGRVDASCE